MSITFADVANGRALHQAAQGLAGYKAALEQHLKQDYEKIRAEFESGIKHFEAEVARLRGLLPARVLEHIDEGQTPNDAMLLTKADEPTKAEKAAAAAASPPETPAPEGAPAVAAVQVHEGEKKKPENQGQEKKDGGSKPGA